MHFVPLRAASLLVTALVVCAGAPPGWAQSAPQPPPTTPPPDGDAVGREADRPARNTRDSQQTVTTVRQRLHRGLLTEFFVTRTMTTYSIRNDDTRVRTYVIEHERQDGRTLDPAGPAPFESTAVAHRFRISVGPSDEGRVTVAELAHSDKHTDMRTEPAEFVRAWLDTGLLAPDIAAAVERILDLRAAVERRGHEQIMRGLQAERLRAEVQRRVALLRGLGTRRVERQLAARYAREIREREDEIAALERASMDGLRDTDAAMAALDAFVHDQSIDRRDAEVPPNPPLDPPAASAVPSSTSLVRGR